MSAVAWQALLGALSEIDRLVARAALLDPQDQPVAAATVQSRALTVAAAGGETEPPSPLAPLHDQVSRCLDALVEKLTTALGDFVAAQVHLPLLIYLDERILDQLPAQLDLAWPPLQHDMLPAINGGEVFFDRLDRRLEHTDTPSFVLEFYYYALESGYQGRLVGQPELLADYRRRLKERLASPPALSSPSSREEPTPSATAASSQRTVLTYYLATAAFVVLLPFLLRYLSNL
ncbi:MAG TPA: DotU family type IV/VI secretion system protein [Polyangia bacterium]|jgi:type VI protein secretion system component VasF|nr:DotU family type IV/VI secretion system protein [Polyangia bacterium]